MVCSSCREKNYDKFDSDMTLSIGKKDCRSLIWRIRAAVKKAMKMGIKRRHFNFQYDPHSYALNFDDGCQHEILGPPMEFLQLQGHPGKTIWVYVLWGRTISGAEVISLIVEGAACNF
ncbi:NHL domain-containing protein [Striga asiatica]|uniref:NHL domain-containing protein n=1 Tax=Striga asiatica TaxID=4170 RepID=A0A5A7PV16_STRAF|nr:NHL domain-containing protein [Striga asiatica]